MEFFIGLILVISLIACLIFFRGTINKSSGYVEDVVTVNVSEVQVDLVKRATTAYTKLVEECGEDFLTPQEIYEKMHKKSKPSESSSDKKKK